MVGRDEDTYVRLWPCPSRLVDGPAAVNEVEGKY